VDSRIVSTYQATIYVAGDLATARAFLRNEAYQKWLCVSLSSCEFIFTGAVESGMAIGFANYPEFPMDPRKIFERAKDIATKLIPVLGQRMAMIVGTDRTEWVTIQPPGGNPLA
jgi:hypothetical protein